jgi:predicted KAP-like P-loop ATPase
VRSAPRHAGFAIAVTGAWGEGKSSVINLVVEELETSHSAQVLEFNPWLFSGTEQLVEHFFEELSAQLSESSDERLRHAAELLRAYGRVVAPLRLIPGVGTVVKGSVDWTREISNAITTDAPSVRQRRAVLRSRLSELERPLLVIIDDLDRLQASEVIDVMRLIRLVGDFPNVIYLLAFDRRRVEEALSGNAGADPGRAFLEKIVQVIHDLPPPRPSLVTELIMQAILSSLEHEDVTLDRAHFDNLFYGGMRDLFVTLRDISRYANVIPAALRLVRDEVEVADVLALEALRVFAPDSYGLLLSNTQGLTGKASARNRSDHAAEAVSHIAGAADTRHAAVALLLRHLFPASAQFTDGGYDEESYAAWRAARRVAHPAILEAYVLRVMRQRWTTYGLAREPSAMVRPHSPSP